MTADEKESRPDEWSNWLLHRRHAGDPDNERRVRTSIERFRDRVLDGAGLTPDMTLVDIGAGDGLIAFGAIDRIGPTLHAMLTDISLALLNHAKSLADERGIAEQCTFLECSAENLSGIPSGSADVVTTRAVLAYVADKPAAFREFHRILKPGGRISIAEPIFRDDAIEAVALKKIVDSQAPESANPFLPLLHRWKAAQFPDTEERMGQSPISNFSERDLVRFVGGCGFVDIRLAFHIDVVPSIITSWSFFLGSSPHPWAPSVGDILATQFTTEERQLFESVMRPTIENQQLTSTERVAYLTASKRS